MTLTLALVPPVFMICIKVKSREQLQCLQIREQQLVFHNNIPHVLNTAIELVVSPLPLYNAVYHLVCFNSYHQTSFCSRHILGAYSPILVHVYNPCHTRMALMSLQSCVFDGGMAFCTLPCIPWQSDLWTYSIPHMPRRFHLL